MLPPLLYLVKPVRKTTPPFYNSQLSKAMCMVQFLRVAEFKQCFGEKIMMVLYVDI